MIKCDWDEVRKYYEEFCQKHKPLYVNRVQNILYKFQRNFIICFVGDPGKGKSWACLHFSLLIDPTFFIINNLSSFDRLQFGEMADQFMRVMNKPGLLKTGNADMWDEIGRGLPKKEWYELINRATNKFIQSFRWRRLLLSASVPDRSYVDKDTMSLFNAIVEMEKVDFRRNISIGKIKEVQVNRITGKPYYKYPRVVDKWGRIIELRKIHFSKPPDDVVEIYESKKKKWLKIADKNLQMMIESRKKKMLRDIIEPGVVIDELLSGNNYKKYLRQGRFGPMIEPGKIIQDYNVGSKMANMIKNAVEMELKKEGKIS